MSKPSVRDWDSFKDFGIFSESLLRNLDTVQKINDGLRDASAAIDCTADIRGIEADITSAKADIGADIRKANLDIRGVVARTCANALLPRSAVGIANDRLADVRVALDRANAGLGAARIANIAGTRTPPDPTDCQAFDDGDRISPKLPVWHLM